VTFWAEVFLGVIALATFTMAAIQVGALVYGWTVARRVNRVLATVELQMQPLAENLNAMARDGAKISALAVGQAERVDRLVTDLSARIEHTATTVQHAIVKPLRDGGAMLSGAKAAIEVLRELARPASSRVRPEDEDALFIG
jgi:hypothetical protein